MCVCMCVCIFEYALIAFSSKSIHVVQYVFITAVKHRWVLPLLKANQ